eukprot:g36860.t1
MSIWADHLDSGVKYGWGFAFCVVGWLLAAFAAGLTWPLVSASSAIHATEQGSCRELLTPSSMVRLEEAVKTPSNHTVM